MIRKVGTLDEVARRLYTRTPEEFTAARDEAVRDARDAGDRGLATEIGKLRRPTQAAWLANLLALRRGEDVTAWLALGDEMRDAHHQLSGARLRELSTRRAELVEELLAAAKDLASSAGRQPTDATVTELRATLQAALADADVADALRAGRLQRAATYSGLGFAPGFENAGVPTAEKAEPAAPQAQPARPRLRLVEPKVAATEQLTRAREGVAAAEQAVEAAAAAEQEARAAYDDFGARLAELREEISELEEHRAEADRARRRHTRERERAERELSRARRRLDRVDTGE